MVGGLRGGVTGQAWMKGGGEAPRCLGKSTSDKQQQVQRPEVGAFSGSLGPRVWLVPPQSDTASRPALSLQHPPLHSYGVFWVFFVPQDCLPRCPSPLPQGPGRSVPPQTLPPFWNSRLLAGTVSLSSASRNFVGNLVTGLRGGSCGRDRTGLSPSQSQEQRVFEGRTRVRRPRPHRQTRCPTQHPTS